MISIYIINQHLRLHSSLCLHASRYVLVSRYNSLNMMGKKRRKRIDNTPNMSKTLSWRLSTPLLKRQFRYYESASSIFKYSFWNEAFSLLGHIDQIKWPEFERVRYFADICSLMGALLRIAVSQNSECYTTDQPFICCSGKLLVRCSATGLKLDWEFPPTSLQPSRTHVGGWKDNSGDFIYHLGLLPFYYYQ